jgi:hypothetical protein
MAEFLTDGGWVSNALLVFIVVGYTAVGLVFGFVWGHERAERKSHAREWETAEYWRSYYSHPSNH